MARVREPAVAGTFYPSDPSELRAVVGQYLEAAPESGAEPKAMILPHAGYVYSGPVAATGYACLSKMAEVIRRVVLLGPAHTAAFYGLAASTAELFATPLGEVAVDREAVAQALNLPPVDNFDTAHAREHSLEVHLPFLQLTLSDFTIVPLVVGQAKVMEVAEVIDSLWGGPETLIIVSSDLSHYYDYQTARQIDQATCRAIEQMEDEQIGREAACGAVLIRALVAAGRRRGVRSRTLDLRNSGDTAGSRDRVVGYATIAFQ